MLLISERQYRSSLSRNFSFIYLKRVRVWIGGQLWSPFEATGECGWGNGTVGKRQRVRGKAGKVGRMRFDRRFEMQCLLDSNFPRGQITRAMVEAKPIS